MMCIKTSGKIMINSTITTIKKITLTLINTNKNVIGKFKEEAADAPITEFVGLRSKLYSYVRDNDKGVIA